MYFAIDLYAQSSGNMVTVSSVINEKAVKSDKLKLEIKVGDKTLSPPIIQGRFAVDVSDWPDEIKDNICLRVTYKQYVLEFMDLTKDHFRGAWKVFVSKPDSPSEDIPNPDAVDYVYSIEFYSGNSIGTVRSKIKYKETD
jgi:hypothetical protein